MAHHSGSIEGLEIFNQMAKEPVYVLSTYKRRCATSATLTLPSLPLVTATTLPVSQCCSGHMDRIPLLESSNDVIIFV